MTYQELWKSLSPRYGEHEAKAVARYLLEVGYGLSMADILGGATERIFSDEMGENQRRLLNGEPVQYVVGKAEFGGRTFRVSPNVLIPRPETYELCQWILSESKGNESILDIGTGSGCIAITLAAELPQSQVSAWDISEETLCVARENARLNNVSVDCRQVDALNIPDNQTNKSAYDIIVSNPPYICQKEATDMESHVLDHEPHRALFVPDDDPLLFYRAIARHGLTALKEGGKLYFEINPIYVREMEEMLDEMGYNNIETRKDQFGKERFTRAQR